MFRTVLLALVAGAAACSSRRPPRPAAGKRREGGARRKRPAGIGSARSTWSARSPPVDQVTISSEADGKVSRILADLGDRVKAGQVLIEIDSEKQQYTLRAAAGGARARARAVRGQPIPSICRNREDARRQRANSDLVQATQAFNRATSCSSGP